MSEQNGTSPKKPRGRGPAKKTLDLIEAIKEITEAAQPITGRGVGYKLFVRKLISSMKTGEMKRVYRVLKDAREDGTIPWEWIVDETRDLEKTASWNDPDDYTRTMINAYRRDYWNQQPVRVEVWSEKGTVRGVLRPVLDEYGVGFRVFHGFTSATSAYSVSQAHGDDRPLVAFYVGDWDPGGMCMSEHDLPGRLKRYDGHHVKLNRIALTQDHLPGLISFPASDKAKDTRYKWFTQNYGHECWELDALDPNDLRARVETEIKALIEPVAWERCKVTERAEEASLRAVMKSWKHPGKPQGWGLL
jgi:hypothetical protein